MSKSRVRTLLFSIYKYININHKEGIKRTIDSFSHLTAQNPPKKEVNDTVQWKKQTLIAIVILITLYINLLITLYINFVATTGYSAIPIAILVALTIFFLRFFGNKKSD
ncbi:unnamed protein product [Brassica rapa subsp. trilocularis]